MKNDLTKFEKDLLRSINNIHSTNYDYRNFMEWNTDKSVVEKNLEEGEVIYSVLGAHVTIKP